VLFTHGCCLCPLPRAGSLRRLATMSESSDESDKSSSEEEEAEKQKPAPAVGGRPRHGRPSLMRAAVSRVMASSATARASKLPTKVRSAA
jgi:hypothetical protein